MRKDRDEMHHLRNCEPYVSALLTHFTELFQQRITYLEAGESARSFKNSQLSQTQSGHLTGGTQPPLSLRLISGFVSLIYLKMFAFSIIRLLGKVPVL